MPSMSICVFLWLPHFLLNMFHVFEHHILLNMQENKCKVLEITPHDLKGNHYDIITYVCLCMLSDVAMKNVTTNANEEVLHITKGV